MYSHGMIAPVVALIIWSLVMLIWLYFTRIPAMQMLKIKPGSVTKEQIDAMPTWATRPAANYNHLMEQPTLFYAVCFALQFIGEPSANTIGWAWLYVALRLLHSLVQGTVNIIPIRFLIFVVASVALGVLAFKAAVGVGVISWAF